MKKKLIPILATIGSILLLGSIYWGITVYKEIKSPSKAICDAVNKNDIVIRINDAAEFFNELDLPQFDLLKRLKLNLHGQHRQWIHWLRSTPLIKDIDEALLLMQLESKDSVSICLVLAIEPSCRKALKQYLDKELKAIDKHRYVSTGYPNLYVAFCDGLLMLSPDQKPIETAYKQVQSGQSAMLEPSFEKVWSSAGRNVSANVWFHVPSLIPKLMSYYEIQAPFRHLFENLSRGAQWVEYDVFRRLDVLILSGYAAQEKEQAYGLHAIDYLQETFSEVQDFIPANSQFFIALSNSDFKQFYESNRSMNPSDTGQSDLELLRPGLSELVQEFFLQCHPREMAFFVYEDPDKKPQSAGVLLLDDISEACQGLGLLTQYVHNRAVEWQDNQIQNTGISALFSEGLWSVFPKMEPCFVLRKGRALFFSDKEDNLRYIEKCLDEKLTLNRNRNYSQLKPYLHEKTNLSVFVSNIRYLFPEGPAHCLNLQFSGNEGTSYALALLSRVVKNDSILTGPLPKPLHVDRITNLFKGRILKGPWPVANHRVKDTFYFLQDDKQVLHYLDSKGEVLWRRSVDGTILSQVYEVDYLGNTKIQYLFNTRKSLYLLDIYGRLLKDFPVSFKVPASGAIEVLYATIPNRYRIRFTDENGNTHILSKEARKVK